MSKGVLSSVNSQEVKLLVSSPRLVSGNSLWESIQDFESLDENLVHKGFRRRSVPSQGDRWYELQNST